MPAVRDGRSRVAACGHPAPCGCAYGGPCCETCTYHPLYCVDEIPAQRRLLYFQRIERRNAAIREAVRGGATVASVAEAMNLSERQVFRICGDGGAAAVPA